MTSKIGVKKIQYPNGTDILTLDSSGSLAIGGTVTSGGDVTFDSAGAVLFDKSDQSLKFGDNYKAKFGASGDLEIYHDTVNGNSVIHDNGSGNLRIRADDFQVTNAAASANLMFANDATGEVKLYHNGSEKLATASNGIDVTGTTTTDNLTVEGSGVNFTVNQTANNLTATFKGAGLGTMELEGTASGAFIDMKQGSNDYDVRFGANNTGGYAAMGSGANGFSFNFADGSGSGTVTVSGTLNKTSGSFRISHPLESKKDTHHLFHSFVEGPQCDNLYRGKVTLSSGSATVNLDTKSGMSDGTFVALNRDIQCFTTNETGWTPIKGSVSGNVLTITAQDNSCTDTISWLVIGERQDDEIKASSLTDNDGNLVVEKLKSEAHDANQNYGVM